MPFKTKRQALVLAAEDKQRLESPRRSRTGEKREALHAGILQDLLRGIRVATKQELVDRIHLYFEQINADPVIFRWKYKMEETSVVWRSTEQ
jgi:hypothetical protein